MLRHSLFLLSGLAGLGWQVAWTRMFGAGLGHEVPALLGVVTAFMAGLGAGSWWLDGWIKRCSAPARCYAALELVLAGWGATLIFLLPLGNRLALSLMGPHPDPARQWLVTFAVPLLLLLPSTLAMGGTLPAMQRMAAGAALGASHVGGLYAANTFGAVLGTLATTFWVLPALGYQRSMAVLAGLNALCGLGALVLGRSPVGEHNQATTNATLPLGRVRAALLVTGLLGMGFQLVSVRVLAQVLEGTVYTYAAVLSVYLLGSALGGACEQRWGDRLRTAAARDGLWLALGLVVLAELRVLGESQGIYDWARTRMGDSRFGVLGAEMLLAGCALFAPSVLLGFAFSHYAQEGQRQTGSLGKLAALNTLGCAAAGMAFNLGCVPWLGTKWTLATIGLGFLALLTRLTAANAVGLALCGTALFLAPADLHIVQLPKGGKTVAYKDGAMASVAVVEDAAGQKSLRVDNRFQMGGTGVAEAEYRHAHLPLLLHPAPKRALFLGLGTGITLGAASLHPGLHADGVELVPTVVEMMPWFEPHNFSATHNPAITVLAADARRFARTSGDQYDVIVADLFHPARDGAGNLYTLEHFQAIRERLAPGGVFCQWLPLHQMDEAMLKVVTRTFLEVFPTAEAWLLRFNVQIPVIGLVARPTGASSLASDGVERRLSDPGLAAALKKLSLADSLRLYGHLLAGPDELKAYAGNGPLNTDDRPVVMFAAPDFVYQKDSTTFGRLEGMLGIMKPKNAAGTLGLQDPAGSFSAGLTAYISARDVYLKGLIAEMKGRVEEGLEAYVESARLSPDFTSGYAECLSIAAALGPRQPERARALLEKLAAAQPGRGVAQQLLERMARERP